MGEHSEEKQILLDSDVVRHFLKGGLILYLPKIFPNRFAILDSIRDELCRSPHLKQTINNFIVLAKIPVLNFPLGGDILKEYARLRKEGLGEGESACMAYARFNKNVIASSNLKDIKSYCQQYSIEYLTTMDILVIGLNRTIFSESQCDNFIQEVKAKGSKLPTDTIKEFIQKFRR